MNAHQLSQITNSARIAPVVPKTSKHRISNKKDVKEIQDYNRDDTMEVKQKEPQNFRSVSNVERTKLDSFSVDRNSLTAQFYDKIQELKSEHQRTLTLLNQFYEEEKYKNAKSHQTQHSFPDYLDYTEGNTFFYRNTPDRGADRVPGYSDKVRVHFSSEKSDSEKEVELSSNADSTDVINRMWDNFSVEDYSEDGNRRPILKNKTTKTPVRPKSAPVKTKEWTPVITIPKPFNMTLREEQKKGKSHTRSSVEVSLRQKMKEEEEQREQMKKICAREPPAHIYLPLYEEMCERQEQRSRFNKENSVATTMAIQKPFSFAERDERKLKVKEIMKKEWEDYQLKNIKQLSKFEAQPVPHQVSDSTITDRQQEEALYRKIKAKLRSEDMMRVSAYPARMQTHEMLSSRKKQYWLEKMHEQTTPPFRPQTSSVPDFNALHKREELEIMNRKPSSETVIRPFNLHTSQRSKSRMETTRKSEKEEERTTRKHKPGVMPVFSDTLPTRLSESSRLRTESMARKSIQDADYLTRKVEEWERLERRKILKEQVKQRSSLNTQSSSLGSTKQERLRQYKKELRDKQSEYSRFLQDIQRRVDQRPLLIEQHDERVAKEQAERRYARILRESGINEVNLKSKDLSSSYAEDSGDQESKSEQPDEETMKWSKFSSKYSSKSDVDGSLSDHSFGGLKASTPAKKHVEFA